MVSSKTYIVNAPPPASPKSDIENFSVIYQALICRIWGRCPDPKGSGRWGQTGDTPLTIGAWESGKISLMMW